MLIFQLLLSSNDAVESFVGENYIMNKIHEYAKVYTKKLGKGNKN